MTMASPATAQIVARETPWSRHERQQRLRVVQAPVQPTPRQDCSRCRNIKNCWQPGVDARVIAINLLVCRMKRGINVNATTKILLDFLHVKLVKEALRAVKGTSAEHEEVLHDFESATIDYIKNHYVMGEIAYPLHYLFGFPNGVITRYANTYRERLLRNQHDFVSYDDEATADDHSSPRALPEALVARPTCDEDIDDQRVTRRMDRARDVIDDGYSLPFAEWRVLRFCLTNARDGGAKRPLNGLHTFLATVMDEPRSRVTTLYAQAGATLVRIVQGQLSV